MSALPPPPPPTSDEAPQPAEAPKAKRKALIVPVIASALGLTLGLFAGMAANDPVKSDEYAAAQAEIETLKSSLESSRAETKDAKESHRKSAVDIADRETAASKKSSEVHALEQELNELSKELEEREAAVGAAEEKQLQNTIGEGVWTVGDDIEPGTYKVTTPIDVTCYWAIMKTGSNGSLITNDIVEGGRPSVTLKVGQDFKNQDCGPWSKVN